MIFVFFSGKPRKQNILVGIFSAFPRTLVHS